MRIRTAVSLLVFALLPAFAFAQDKPDALELYRTGKYSDAIIVCQQELQETPKNIDSHVVLGWSYLKLKQYQEAINAGRKGLEIAPNDPRLIQIIGEGDVFLGKIDDALINLEEYVALRPGGDRIARVYWLMGECYISLREYQNADIAISTALYFEPNNPSSASWWARLGYAREMANDLKRSQEAYSRALTIDPGLADALRGKERVDKKLGG
jgi:tetratricopeptide (TPR) repeat protein